MLIVFAVITLLIVAVIGLVAVGGVTAKLAGQPPLPLFDLDEAVAYVAERVPFDVAAELTHDDVRQLMAWHLEYLQDKGVAFAPVYDDDDEGDGGVEDESSARDGSSDAVGPDRRPVDVDATADPAIAEDDEGVAFVLGRAHAAGIELDDVQVVLVLEAEMSYLEAIGAIGTPVDPPADAP